MEELDTEISVGELIETIEYDNPVVEVERPHIFNEEYEKEEERTRKNKECSQVISEITRKMNDSLPYIIK